MPDPKMPPNLDKAAQRGEPSYVWRAGQERRLDMITTHGGQSIKGTILVNGCGIGAYLQRLSTQAQQAVGIDIELSRLMIAKEHNDHLICAAGEYLPFKENSFHFVLSNEVLEHVADDQAAIHESDRVLKKNGIFILFCPNRGYMFETHGVFWQGRYHFGNKLFVNYFPKKIRDRLVPHVRVYTRKQLKNLFFYTHLHTMHHTTIFGAYDNIIHKIPRLGKLIRTSLHFLEKTPLNVFGLSHFWVMKKGTKKSCD